MKRTKVILCSLLSLPREILFDIISRLPIKSLLQCKTLNKNWFQLLTSPGFVKLHMEHTKRNNPRLLFTSSVSGGNLNLQSLEYDLVKPHAVSYNFPLASNLLTVGTCNGLVCLSDYKTILILCNPATKEQFPVLFDLYQVLPDDYSQFFVLGFGYDPIGNEYKVVRFETSYSNSTDDESCKVDVYTFGIKGWRMIQLQVQVPKYKYQDTMIYVNGALHFFERTSDCRLKDANQFVTQIVSLDVWSEKFRRIPLILFSVATQSSLRVLNECLSLIVIDVNAEQLEVWSMKEYGVNNTWTKVLSVSFKSFTQTCGLSFSSEHLLQIHPLVVGKEKVILTTPTTGDWSTVPYIYTYDPVSTKVEVHTPAISWRSVDTFFESLVSINSFSGGQKYKTFGRKRSVYTYFA